MSHTSCIVDPAILTAELPNDFFQLSFDIEWEFLVAYEKIPEYYRKLKESIRKNTQMSKPILVSQDGIFSYGTRYEDTSKTKE